MVVEAYHSKTKINILGEFNCEARRGGRKNMFNKLKKIISLLIGIPAAIVFCSESNDTDGFILQLIALATLVLVLAFNGVFNRKELEW